MEKIRKTIHFYLKLFQVAVRLFFGHKKENFDKTITFIAIFVSFCALDASVLGVKNSLRAVSTIYSYSGDLLIYPTTNKNKTNLYEKNLPHADFLKLKKELSKLETVEYIAPIQKGIGSITDGCSHFFTFITGISDVDRNFLRNSKLAADTNNAFLPSLRNLSQPKNNGIKTDFSTISLSTGLMKTLGKEHENSQFSIQEPLFCDDPTRESVSKFDSYAMVQVEDVDGSPNEMEFEISEIHTTMNMELEDNHVVINQSKSSELFRTDNYSYLAVYIDQLSNLAASKEQIKRLLRNISPHLNVADYDSMLATPGVHGALHWPRQLFLVSKIFVVLFFIVVLFNFVLISFKKRHKEFNVFYMLGYRRSHLFSLIFFETMFCSLIAIIAGVPTTFFTKVVMDAIEFPYHILGLANSGFWVMIMKPNFFYQNALLMMTFGIMSIIAAFLWLFRKNSFALKS